jgi:hypothetical protein
LLPEATSDDLLTCKSSLGATAERFECFESAVLMPARTAVAFVFPHVSNGPDGNWFLFETPAWAMTGGSTLKGD